jgi:RimJ/RimL family protein N-acetyltransferase
MNIDELITQVKTLSLETERLSLRKIAECDFDTMVNHEQNHDIMRYIRPVVSIVESQAKIRACIDDWQGEEGQWLMLAVLLKTSEGNTANSELIGMVCIRIESLEFKRIEIGYRFDANFHGKGYAFEAAKCVTDFLFQQVNIHKLLAYCVADHHASYHLMEKLGMQREACLRQHTKLADNQWHDELIYGLLAQDL